jgi:hypothetical protein
MATRRYVAKELQLDPNSNGTGPVLTAAQLAAMLAAGSPQPANLIYAGPSSGGNAAPTFRSLVANDLPTVPITKGGTGATTAEGARAALGIDTALAGKQNADPLLSAIAALSTTADRLIYTTGVDTVALSPLTSFARSLLDDADAATARATLGLGANASVTFGALLATNITGVTIFATNVASTSVNAQSLTGANITATGAISGGSANIAGDIAAGRLFRCPSVPPYQSSNSAIVLTAASSGGTFISPVGFELPNVASIPTNWNVRLIFEDYGAYVSALGGNIIDPEGAFGDSALQSSNSWGLMDIYTDGTNYIVAHYRGLFQSV